MSYKVGDILWVVGRERPGVRVYQVVEELTKKTLSGTITTYKVQAPAPSGKAKKTSIDSLEGDIYNDSNSAKEEMLSRTKAAIDKMISANQNLINRFFKEKEAQDLFENTENKENTDDSNLITMPDGTKARLKTKIGDVL
tara:strand:+ start:221 stop:640 length:420 start_codon:yes stop_codon:yes gene_type:complete